MPLPLCKIHSSETLWASRALIFPGGSVNHDVLNGSAVLGHSSSQSIPEGFISGGPKEIRMGVKKVIVNFNVDSSHAGPRYRLSATLSRLWNASSFFQAVVVVAR